MCPGLVQDPFRQLRLSDQGPFGPVLLPTRELALQVANCSGEARHLRPERLGGDDQGGDALCGDEHPKLCLPRGGKRGQEKKEL